MMTKGIIVTGSTGFIGSRLIEKLENKNLIFVDKKNLNFYDYKNKQINNLESKFNQIDLVHLATHYSKDSDANDKIYDANIRFGKDLIKKLEKFNINKIIYTNTMFRFYDDVEINNLYYTKTKNEFSNYLDEFTSCNGVLFEEIYLDNTFGNDDKRKKIISQIINAIHLGLPNPVINKNTNINLVPINEVVQKIKSAIKENISKKSIFINQKNININSIFNFLEFFNQHKEIDSSKLKFFDTEYKQINLELEKMYFNPSDTPVKLIDVFLEHRSIENEI
jgi:nucleoside-diphosphate-sugar epimerase